MYQCWNAAAIARTLHEAKAYGFSIKKTAPFNWKTFKHKRDAYVERLKGIYAKNLGNDDVEWLRGRAYLLAKNEAEVVLNNGSKEKIRAKKILLATGGHPNIPKTPGSELGITSDGFFDLEKRPQKVALVGAGYIAVEMAGMFHHLGSETHLFIRHDKFLRKLDPMIQDKIVSEYERQGIVIHRNSSQSKVEKDPEKAGSLKLHYSDSETESGVLDIDCLLWAIGRSPEVEDLGLDRAGVKQNERGQIIADDYQNTNVDGIYSHGNVLRDDGAGQECAFELQICLCRS